uniref:RxLR effector candidate protein n=1 Tax=Hyaloperonospora arabidopsidis (strain Emoy2) TaxID=559515 RepID=A0A090B8D2_HYAAE
MRLAMFALMGSTPTFARNINTSGSLRPSLRALSLPVSVRFPDGSYNGHIKRSLGDLESTLGEERAGPPLPVLTEEKFMSAASTLASAIHSHGLALEEITDHYRKLVRSLDLYAVKVSLENIFTVPLTAQVLEDTNHEMTLASYTLQNALFVKESLDGRDTFIYWVRQFVSNRQQAELLNSENDRLEWLKNNIPPSEVFTNLAIAGKTGWVDEKKTCMVNPFASPKFEVMKAYIQMYNEEKGKTTSWIEVFLGFYKTEGKVARMLSLLQFSLIVGREAQEVLHEMYARWVTRKATIPDIAQKLRITSRPLDGLSGGVELPLIGYILYMELHYPEEKERLAVDLSCQYGDAGYALLSKHAEDYKIAVAASEAYKMTFARFHAHL